jgi:hypothetical protein
VEVFDPSLDILEVVMDSKVLDESTLGGRHNLV